MKEALTQAVKDGIILGVRYGVALLMLLAALSWFMGDYSLLRQAARHGEIAWQRQEDVIAQQRAARARTPSPPAPATKE